MWQVLHDDGWVGGEVDGHPHTAHTPRPSSSIHVRGGGRTCHHAICYTGSRVLFLDTYLQVKPITSCWKLVLQLFCVVTVQTYTAPTAAVAEMDRPPFSRKVWRTMNSAFVYV